jgi:hypothetical protein
MEERIGKDEDITRPMQGEDAAAADAAERVEFVPTPEKPERVPPTIYGSIGHQLVTLAIIGLAVALLMLAVWMGEPA